MNTREKEYYKNLFYNLNLDQIKSYMPEYISIIETKNIFEFKEYCIRNKIDIGDFCYSNLCIKDLFEDKSFYVFHNERTGMFALRSSLDSLKYFLFFEVILDKDSGCKFIQGQPPFDNEAYKKKLLEKALDIITNDFDEDDLQNFIHDYS